MIFFFRAVFWTLVVSAFIPAGFYAPEDGAFARQAGGIAATTLSADTAAPLNTSAVCQDREAFCETAGEFARFAGWAASLAADRAEAAYQDFAETRTPATSPARAPATRSADEIFAAAAGEPAAR